MTPLTEASFSVAFLVGAASGLHTSTWGMYKDAPHEGFTWRRYFRSVLVATAIAPLVWSLFQLPEGAAGLVLLFGVTYALERALTEFYKTFLRDQPQSKYTIPMQFAVFGRPVESPWLRLLAGMAHVGVVLLVIALLSWMQANLAHWPWWLRAALVGSLGGWISAFGGAWKDAPIEGFQLFKFFRSPGIALAWALPLAMLTDNLVLVTFSALGFTIATIETWKTFFFPSVPRGKFANKPIHFPQQLSLRQRFVPLYVGIWVQVLLMFAVALVARLPNG